MTEPESLVNQFIIAACVPRDASHSSGDNSNGPTRFSRPIRTSAVLDIHTAAVLGDDVLVREFLDADRASATGKRRPV